VYNKAGQKHDNVGQCVIFCILSLMFFSGIVSASCLTASQAGELEKLANITNTSYDIIYSIFESVCNNNSASTASIQNIKLGIVNLNQTFNKTAAMIEKLENSTYNKTETDSKINPLKSELSQNKANIIGIKDEFNSTADIYLERMNDVISNFQREFAHQENTRLNDLEETLNITVSRLDNFIEAVQKRGTAPGYAPFLLIGYIITIICATIIVKMRPGLLGKIPGFKSSTGDTSDLITSHSNISEKKRKADDLAGYILAKGNIDKSAKELLMVQVNDGFIDSREQVDSIIKDVLNKGV
jgi:hypothetical protein